MLKEVKESSSRNCISIRYPSASANENYVIFKNENYFNFRNGEGRKVKRRRRKMFRVIGSEVKKWKTENELTVDYATHQRLE